jgi:hypothetical protein
MQGHFVQALRAARRATKALLPDFINNAWYRLHSERVRRRLAGLSVKEKFTAVYKDHLWGRSDDPSDGFFSGTGSRDPKIVDVYVSAVAQFLSRLARKPNVVDLGCGDFFVGSRVRHLCDAYVACDVVESLIARNRSRFSMSGTEFRVVDITEDSLPPGDIVFIRQVLQHLANADIQKVITKVRQSYEFLVLTEHVPCAAFTPNVDHISGPDTRPNSGVVLTAPPFNLPVIQTTLLCEIPEYGSVIRTLVYQLKPSSGLLQAGA